VVLGFLRMTIDDKIWTPENMVFDSKKVKIPFEEKGGVITLPKIYPLNLEDPSHKELRYSQTITNWLITHTTTRIEGEGIIGCGKTEAGEELKSLFPALKTYKEKVDPDVFLTFYLDMDLHGKALQPYLGHERRKLNVTVGTFTSPSYKDRSPLADSRFARLLGMKEDERDLQILEDIIMSNPYRPQMMYFFDCSVDTALARIKERAKEDPTRIFEIPGDHGILSPEKIASIGRGLHELIHASKNYRDPKDHEQYISNIKKKGLPSTFISQGVSKEYLEALSNEYSKFGDLCRKFKQRNVLATIDVNNIDFKDPRYRLALVYALKVGKCLELMRDGFTIEENKTDGYFRLTSPYETAKEFRPEYQ